MSELTTGNVSMGVSGRTHSIAVSDSVDHAVIAPKGNDGTVTALANAVEESGASVREIQQRTDEDATRVWVKHDVDESVPGAVDSLLTEWGFTAVTEMPTCTTYSK